MKKPIENAFLHICIALLAFELFHCGVEAVTGTSRAVMPEGP